MSALSRRRRRRRRKMMKMMSTLATASSSSPGQHHVVSGKKKKTKKTAGASLVVGPRRTKTLSAKTRRNDAREGVVVARFANVSSSGETNDDDDVDDSEKTSSSETTTAIALATIEREGDAESETEYELVGPKPERFKVAEGQLAGLLTAATPASTRLISGVLTQGWKASLEKGPAPDGEYTFGSFGGRYLKETSDTESFKRPEKPLKLYEFEGCPFCRKVREAIVWLDLDPVVYPCPQGGKRFREFVQETGGKAQFPYLIDENTGVKMYESDDIIEYLYENYGPGKDKVPSLISRSPVVTVAAGLGMLGRMGKGNKLDANSKAAEKAVEPIVFYGYETSPFCKIVRERLVELEIPHQIKSTGRGSYKRKELLKKRGTFQVPYIEDPNTKKAMFESKAILEYLNREYA